MELTIKITRTKTGLPAIAETGGAIGKTKGFAQIICRDDGSKKVATYIPKPEELDTVGHAVFILQNRDYIIQVERSRSTSYTVTVAQFIGNIGTVDRDGETEEYAVFEVRHVKSGKRWDIIPPESMEAAIDAAVAKSSQENQEAVWYERKQPPAPLPAKPSVPVPPPAKSAPAAFAEEYVPGFVAIKDVRQTAADEISVCLTNGVQLCVYIKACSPGNYKAAGE